MGGDDLLERVEAKFAGKFNIKPPLKAPADATPSMPEPEAMPPGDGHLAEDFGPLPSPGDPYKAFSRPANKEQPTLRLLLSRGDVRGLAYANLDSLDLLEADQPGKGPEILMLFAGAMPREVVISGRHLTQLYDLLGDHRIRWVREICKGRDFENGDEPVITGIEFRQPQVRL